MISSSAEPTLRAASLARTATMCRPGESFIITADASYNGDYQVLAVASDFKSFTFNTAATGTSAGGNVDFIPMDIKMCIAEQAPKHPFLKSKLNNATSCIKQ